ncbi:MAG: ABC transporter substrate-binding protein [Acetobacteraceae bacterium]
MPKRTTKYSVLSRLTAAALMATTAFSTQALAAKDVIIGYVDDLSSAAAEAGTDSLYAVKIALAEINAKGGIGGRPVKLIAYDSKTDPQLAATFVTRLAEDDDALAVIGGNQSVPTAAAIPAANEEKIPYFGLTAAIDSFTNPITPYYFRIGGSNSQDAAAIAAMIASGGFRRIAIINNSLSFGIDGGNAMERELKAKGVPIVARETYDINAADLVPPVIKVRDAKPDIIIIYPYPADGGRIVRTMYEMKVDAFKIVSRQAMFDAFRKISGDTSNGVLINNTADLDRPDVQKFMQTLIEQHGKRPPAFYTFAAYDAARIVMEVAAQPEVQAALAKDDVPAARVAARNAVERIGKFVGLQGHTGASYQFSATRHQGPPDSNWFTWLELRNGGFVDADLAKVKPPTN